MKGIETYSLLSVFLGLVEMKRPLPRNEGD